MNDQSYLWNQYQQASALGSLRGLVQPELPSLPRDTRPLLERLKSQRIEEENKKEQYVQRIKEIADRMREIDEAIVMCQTHPHVVALFDVVRRIGLTD